MPLEKDRLAEEYTGDLMIQQWFFQKSEKMRYKANRAILDLIKLDKSRHGYLFCYSLCFLYAWNSSSFKIK